MSMITVTPSTSLDELLALARRIRGERYGTRITYSPKVFIPLTMLCRDHCGYCTFSKPPAKLAGAYLDPDQVLEIARAGAAAGCHEALFTLGERPEARYPQARQALDAWGYASTVDYLAEACRLVVAETGLLPHANAGALGSEELSKLRPVTASQGMMVESLSRRLLERGGPHFHCDTKLPERRLATLEAAGELQIPFTTGILVGIGETRAERLEALATIDAAHRRHGHVQEVIVQNFLPKPGTAMAAASPPPTEEYLWTIAAARVLLDPSIHLQAPPNLTGDFGALLEAGIDDWGGVSPVTADHVNPERPWPALERLREVTEDAGFALAPRLTIYPGMAAEPERWLDEAMRFPVLDRADAEGLARDAVWSAGDLESPPSLIPAPSPTPTPTAGGRVGEVLTGVLAGQQPGEDELVALFGARGPELRAVAEVADELRGRAVGEVVTFVRNRNINYTNVCTFRCRFCAFSKGPLSLNLRGAPYLLGLDEIAHRVVEADARGATEVTLQGDLGGAAGVGLDHPVGDLVQAEQVGGAAEVEAERSLGEGAEAAAEGAHVGVVDVAVADEGDDVADRLAAELVGDLGDRPDLRPAGGEQGDDLVLAELLPLGHPGEHLPHPAAGPRAREPGGIDDRRRRLEVAGGPAVLAAQPLGVGAVQHREAEVRVEPALRFLRELRVDRQPRSESHAGGLGHGPEALQCRPGALGVDVVGGDRAHPAPVVDAGLQQHPEVLGEVGRRLQVHGRVQDDPRRRDRPQVLLQRGRRHRRHRRARLGTEVLDDDLLDVAVPAVGGPDGGQRLQPLGAGLADAHQDPGGERDRQLPGGLQGGEPAGRQLGLAAGVRAAWLVQPLRQRLEHHALAGADPAERPQLLGEQGAGVGVGQQPGLGQHQPARLRQVLHGRGVAEAGERLAGHGVALLGPLPEGEQRLVAAGRRPRPRDLQHLLGREVRLGREPGGWLGEGAVAAVVAAEHGERDEHLGRVGDPGDRKST